MEISIRYPIVSGVTGTAEGIVSSGDIAGRLLVLDSDTGKLLRALDTGGSVAGGVVTCAESGRQYVGTTSGNISKITFRMSAVRPKIVIFALDGESLPEINAEQISDDGHKILADTGKGRDLFATYCSSCHGAHGEGSVGPPLKHVQQWAGLDEIVGQIKAPRGAMPKLYPSLLNDDQVVEVATSPTCQCK